MKQIEFNEDQLGNLQGIAEALFSDSDDPTSYAYKRELVRPRINWFLVLVNILLPLACAAGLYLLLVYLHISTGISLVCSIAALIVYILLNLKRALICAIQIYQRFAPASIRNKCRFEPSCSQYMILSLQKYGLLKGLKKGIHRLKRCNVHDGGFDYP